MAGAFGALAPGLAAALVTLDKRAAEDCLERRHLAHKRVAAPSQAGSRFVFDFHQTTYITGLILPPVNTFFNLFVLVWLAARARSPVRKASPHRTAAAANPARRMEKDQPGLSTRAQC